MSPFDFAIAQLRHTYALLLQGDLTTEQAAMHIGSAIPRLEQHAGAERTRIAAMLETAAAEYGPYAAYVGHELAKRVRAAE